MLDINQIEGTSGLLDDGLREQVKIVFSKMEVPVAIRAVVDLEEEKSREMALFLKEIASLHGPVSLALYSKEAAETEAAVRDLNRKYLPVTGLYRDGAYARVQFHGVPGGQEMNSFIFAIYNLAGTGQKLGWGVKRQIEKLDRKANIKVCVSLACHHCPEVVMAAQRIAMLNPNIEAEMLDANLYPDLVEAYKIERVPFIIVDDSDVYMGNKSIEDLIALLKK